LNQSTASILRYASLTLDLSGKIVQRRTQVGRCITDPLQPAP